MGVYGWVMGEQEGASKIAWKLEKDRGPRGELSKAGVGWEKRGGGVYSSSEESRSKLYAMKKTSGRGGTRAWPGFTISKPRKLKVRTSLAARTKWEEENVNVRKRRTSSTQDPGLLRGTGISWLYFTVSSTVVRSSISSTVNVLGRNRSFSCTYLDHLCSCRSRQTR